MAVAPIEKVHLFVHSSHKPELLSSLQGAGIIQLEETKFEGLDLCSSSPDVSEIDHTLSRLRRVLGFFKDRDRMGKLKRLLMPKPTLSLTMKDKVLSFDYSRVLDEMENLEAEKNAALTGIKRLERENEFLEPLGDFHRPLINLCGTRTTEVRIIEMPPSKINRLAEEVEEQPCWFEIISKDRKICRILMIYRSEIRAEIEAILKDIEACLLSLDSLQRKAGPGETVKDLMKKNTAEQAREKERAAALEETMKALAVHRPALMSVHDVLLNERAKALAGRNLGETETVSCFEGWLRAADKRRLLERVASITESVQVFFRPPQAEEEPPIFLDNPEVIRPFEIITGLYGLPDRHALDPTLPLAPFFFIYVGLCISEGGYGLILTLLSLLYLKLGRSGTRGRLFARLALYLGLSNILFGTLFGGWFGFPLRPLLLIDTMKDPILFLGLALLLGFVQVWFGTLLNMIGSLRSKTYADAIFVKGGWLLLLPALILYFITGHTAAMILAAAGAAGIVFFSNPSRHLPARFFGGLYGLYGISGYLSDTLSYSRILALGLSTSVIAMVVNNLTQTVFKIPILGWVLAPFVFAGGHLFNMGISFLGGIVHSMRLQFVEFFTKFYRGGGKPFKPFRLESDYMEIVE